MERLTGNDALGLMEAYSAVHQPTINEEQIWEEVETWVNGLVEEGYDLSDYTWEDMYEAYLSGFGLVSEDQAQQSGQRLGTMINKGLTNVGRGAVDIFGSGLRGLSGQTTTSRNPYARGWNYATGALTAPIRAGAGFAQGIVAGQGGSSPRTPRSGAARPPATSGAARPPATSGAARPPAPQRPGYGSEWEATLAAARLNPQAYRNQPWLFAQDGRSGAVSPPPAAGRGQRQSVTSGAGQRQPVIPASPPAPRSTTTAARPPAALGPTGMPLVGGIERRTPTSAELRAAQQARADASRVSTAFAPSTGSLVSTPSVTSPSTTSVSPSVTATAFAPSVTNLAAKAQQARRPFIPSRAPLMQRQMQTPSF